MRSPDGHRALIELALFRYFRLTIPVLASCALAYVLWTLGAFRNGAASPVALSDWLASFYSFEPHLGDMLQFALFGVYFAFEPAKSWNAVLWTMPVELLGSYALFWLLALRRLPQIQIAVALAACVWLLDSFFFGFPCGFLLAVSFSKFKSPAGRKTAWGGAALLTIGIGLAVVLRTPFREILTEWMSPTVSRNLVAAMVVAGVALLPAAQRALSGRLSRFLGFLSFPLYLVHLPVICSAGAALYLVCAGVLPFWALVAVVSAITIALSVGVAVVFGLTVEGSGLKAVRALLQAGIRRAGEALRQRTARGQRA
jgi:peptidoglycan/LPS O-acetylase OafA/YrhL